MICANCYAETTSLERNCPHCGKKPLLLEQYKISRQIGRGASGFTWLGEDLFTRNKVAIKEVSLRRVGALKEWELFEREAQVLKRLNHKGIPTFLESFTLEGDREVRVYLVMEWIEGLSLEERRKEGPMEEEELLDFLEEMAGLLKHLQEHKPPVIHRDIKPSNLLRDQERYWLIDFGATARLRNATLPGSTVAGSFGYMAPEQFHGEANKGTDIYGLGATALGLATGKKAEDLLQGGLLLDEESSLSRPLESLLMAMVEPESEDRISSAKELLEAIHRTRVALGSGKEEGGTPRWGEPLRAEPRRGDSLGIRALAYMNRGLFGPLLFFLVFSTLYMNSFTPFAEMVSFPFELLGLGNQWWSFVDLFIYGPGNPFFMAHLIGGLLTLLVVLGGPKAETFLRGYPDFFRQWRAMAFWRGRLLSRWWLFLSGLKGGLIRVAFSLGMGSLFFLGSFMVVSLLYEFSRLPVSWPGSWTFVILGGLMGAATWIGTTIVARKTPGMIARFLPELKQAWSEPERRELKGVVESLGRPGRKSEEKEKARKVRDQLVPGSALERLHKEILILLDWEKAKEDPWRRALQYIERCGMPSPELIALLDWVSEGLSGDHLEYSLRVFQCARQMEALARRTDLTGADLTGADLTGEGSEEECTVRPGEEVVFTSELAEQQEVSSFEEEREEKVEG